MKSKVKLSLFAALFALLLGAAAQKAEAADVRFSVGEGHRWSGNREYRTGDSAYGTWYPNDGTTYVYSNSYYGNGYSNGYYNNSYSTPYVYTTPSVQFGTWYGDGYRNHGGSYSGGRNGYGGGYSGGSHNGGYNSSGRH